MLTIEKLAAYGADTKTGLERCMGQEAFLYPPRRHDPAGGELR